MRPLDEFAAEVGAQFARARKFERELLELEESHAEQVRERVRRENYGERERGES